MNSPQQATANGRHPAPAEVLPDGGGASTVRTHTATPGPAKGGRGSPLPWGSVLHVNLPADGRVAQVAASMAAKKAAAAKRDRAEAGFATSPSGVSPPTAHHRRELEAEDLTVDEAGAPEEAPGLVPSGPQPPRKAE